jgi:glycosyltransferase involved in cell wall biosynthesis
MPHVSVIIPCYNQGEFVDEAIYSVLSQTFQDFEIIVVNDGSTDPFTIKHLQQLCFPKTRILHTDNQGLPAARNNGIREAQGKYILPLDADDRIGKTYIEQAVRLLDADQKLGIVYCKGEYFGDRNGEWFLPEYSLEEMLINNLIFCTALFRKSDWEEVGGYDPAMIYGWEDYDFWLSLIEFGRKVEKIPEILFYYRIRSNSMLRSREKKQKIETMVKIFYKHEELYKQNINIFFEKIIDTKGAYLEATLLCRDKNGEIEQLLGTRKIDIKTKTLLFEQFSFDRNCVLQLCLVNEQAIISIKSVQIATSDRTLKNTTFESNAVLVDGILHYFITKEPLLTIYPESPPQTVARLIIELDYVIIGETVPEHLISRLNRELAALRPAFVGLQEYIGRKIAVPSLSFKDIVEKIWLLCFDRTYRSILRSDLFDRKFYLNQYNDIFFREIDPLVHYCKTGWKERRKPNAWFDPEEYSNTNYVPDGMNPLLHYLETGGNS